MARPVHYRRHQPTDERLVGDFVMMEARPEGGVPHALVIAEHWMSVDAVPVTSEADGPQLGSLFVEDPALADNSAVIVCGSAPSIYGDSARDVVARLVQREGQVVYRWGEEDPDTGSVRAMASDGQRVAALRVMAHEDRWVFCWAMGPRARLVQFGAAFTEALSSFQVTQPWTQDLAE